jgi:hypothetical protein
LSQDFAREHERGDSLGWCERLLERAIHHGLELNGVPKLVLPLHVLAKHAALVERLLGPVDEDASRTREPFLCDRIAARQKEQGNARA